MTSSSQHKKEILELIGSIVLSAQESEQYLKAILPFTNSQDPSLSGALARYEKLKKRTLGEVVRKFLDSSTSYTPDLASRLDELVTMRNQIVHHFNETYGAQLRSGQTQAVADSLRAQLVGIDAFKQGLQHTALQLFEAIRDTTFDGTAEYRAMADLCASFRRRFAI